MKVLDLELKSLWDWKAEEDMITASGTVEKKFTIVSILDMKRYYNEKTEHSSIKILSESGKIQKELAVDGRITGI